MTDASTVEIVRSWLREMESCVRDVDFNRARQIFSPEVVGFGSVSSILVGIDSLERVQWRRVWPVIRDFTFALDNLHWGVDGEFIWVACLWTSLGKAPDGSWQNRQGRMTAVLRRSGERWLAVHTHHSLAP